MTRRPASCPSRSTRSSHSIALLLLVALVSCLGGVRAPRVVPSRTLAIAGDSPGARAERPFAVTFASPRGETAEPSEISIVFNRPMRALELAGQESAPPARITTEGSKTPKGAWRWLGTSALIFAPEERLPRATTYTVTVASGTRALDGSTLQDGYTFSFSTPRPRVTSVSPSYADHLVPRSKFDVRFNQPVDPKVVERATRIVVGGEPTRGRGRASSPSVASAAASARAAPAKRSVPFRVEVPKGEIRTLVKIVPTEPLPLASRIDLVVDETLVGTEGPLPSGEAHRTTVSTYGPLEVMGVECWRGTPNEKCAAEGSVQIRLTNSVPTKDVRAHLRIVPPVPLAWGPPRDGVTDWIQIPGRFRAGSKYAVTVTAGLRDQYGQVLARDSRVDVETDDYWPAAEIGVTGTVFEASRGRIASKGAVAPVTHQIPISTVNVDGYDLVTAGLDERAVTDLLDGSRAGGDLFDRARRVAGVRAERVEQKGARNADAVRSVSLDGLLAGKGGRGAAVVGLSYSSRRSRVSSEARVLSVTDLAIAGKMSRLGSLVWVTRLSDASAVAGAVVSIRTAGAAAPTFTATTDANGFVTIPPDRYVPVHDDGVADEGAVVFARLGDDWAYRRVAEMLPMWQLGVSTDLSGRMHPMAMLFTDRGVYRAGEVIRAKGIFRLPRPKGAETPRGRSVRVEGFDGQGDKMFERKVTLDDFGEISFDVPVPKTAHLGSASLRATIEPATSGGSGDGESSREGTAATSVTLAAYRAAEFKVSVESSRPAFTRGDAAGFAVRGDFLFGAPMMGGKVQWTASRGVTSFTPPGAEGYVVDDEAFAADIADASTRGGVFQSGGGALGEKGDHSVALSLDLPHQRGPEVVSVEAEVEDLTRQVIAGRASAVVHPGEIYVALKPPADFFVPKGKRLDVGVLAIEPSGRARAGVPVQVELVRRTWNSVVEATGDGTNHTTSRPVDVVSARCSATTGTGVTGATSCALDVREAGYFILRARAKDAKGHEVASSTPLYAITDAAEGASSWYMADGVRLELVNDKKVYEVGDTARVLVKSPFRVADALITTERAGVFHQERRTLTGPTPTLSIPITDDMRPNAFIGVHLVRGRVASAPEKPRGGGRGDDVSGPAFRLGYSEVRINPDARRLRVAVVTPQKDYRPGDEVDADVAVTDRSGKAARGEVTFYVVDEGVLMLTGYKTPDPLPFFTAPRPLAVFSLESREDLAKIVRRRLGDTGSDKGAEGGGGGSEMRADFRATAFFEPALVTSSDGKAHVRFRLPDNLTTYRLMAVAAAEDDRFGFGEAQVTASRHLMARPALPRFLRAGDAIEAGIVVTSKGLPATDVELTVATEGATVDGPTHRKVSLPANGSLEVRWPISTPSAGKAGFTFTARGAGETDSVRVQRSVTVPTVLEAVALYGETSSASGERLGDLGEMRGDVGGIELRLSSTALVGLGEGMEQLIEYPYGCTEQLTSRLVPLIPLSTLAAEFHAPLPKNLPPVIEETIQKILLNQRPDGSFGYWPDSRSGDPWLTAYALWGLDVAHKHHHVVPEEAIARAIKRLRAYFDELDDRSVGSSTLAFAVDVLAEVGAPDPGYANLLFERRAAMPLFARALLAHAMAISKMSRAQSAELLRDIEAHIRPTPAGAVVAANLGDEYAPLLDSEARTTAMVVRALVAMDPNHPMAARLAKGLLSLRKHGTWQSTQETAWSLLALDAYRRAQEAVSPDFDALAFLGESEVSSVPFHGRSLAEKSASVPAAKLFEGKAGGATLAFQVRGTGKLFYEARLRYARKTPPTDTLDRGFYVRKIVRSVRPEALSDALRNLPERSSETATAGDLVLVDLLVVTRDPREQVVIEDPLPAGLEPVDASLATTARTLAPVGESGGEGDRADADASDYDARANPDTTRAVGSAWFHREMHDDRVLTFVEHMPAGVYHYRYLARATTHGRFVVPPTRAECMYEPEVFGRTAATTFDVRLASKGS